MIHDTRVRRIEHTTGINSTSEHASSLRHLTMALLEVFSTHSMTTWWILAGCFLIYLPVSCFLSYRRCPQFNGPLLAAVSNLWLLKSTLKGRIYLDCAAVLEQYGKSIVRIAPNKLVTNDPELWRSLSGPRSVFTKGTWYDSMALDPEFKNSLSLRDDKAHSKLRAKMIRGYSGKEIPDLESTIDQSIMDLINLIRRHQNLEEKIDIARSSQYFTLDVLTHIAFGHPFGYLTKNEDVYEYIKNVSAFLGFLEVNSNFPIVYSLVSSKVMSFMQPRPTDKTGMGAMLGVAKRVVNERYSPGAKVKDDMLGSFIKNGMTQEEAESESMLQILGGSDSTATSIRMITLFILTNPSVYNKLITELDSARHAGQIYQQNPQIIRSSEAQQLPYLQACIKEGLRVFPPLTGLLSKRAPPGGANYKDIYFPSGMEIGWNPMTMQRRPEIYGSDAQIYRPERWIEAAAEAAATTGVQPANRLDGIVLDTTSGGSTDTEKSMKGTRLHKMNQTLDLVFGHGKYGCLGRTVALMELDKIFVALFDNFEFSLCDPLNPMKTVCHGVHVQTDMWMNVTERKKRDKVVVDEDTIVVRVQSQT